MIVKPVNEKSRYLVSLTESFWQVEGSREPDVEWAHEGRENGAGLVIPDGNFTRYQGSMCGSIWNEWMNDHQSGWYRRRLYGFCPSEN